jgi:ATP-dependent protease ClpP protease subunit
MQPAAYATTTHLHIDDEINEDTVTPLLDGIANAPHGKDDRIVIEIDSPGGEVEYGFKLVKAIERYPGKVVCVVDGEADSMASYIFVSCDVRAMTKRSVMMIHQPGMGGSGQFNDLSNAAEWMRVSGAAMFENYALHMRNITAADLIERTMGGREFWLGWKEAKKYGAVDIVVDRVSDVK